MMDGSFIGFSHPSFNHLKNKNIYIIVNTKYIFMDKISQNLIKWVFVLLSISFIFIFSGSLLPEINLSLNLLGSLNIPLAFIFSGGFLMIIIVFLIIKLFFDELLGIRK